MYSFVMALLALLVLPGPLLALDAERRPFNKMKRSVVLVMGFDDDRKPVSIASGFFVAEGRILVTNYRAIKGVSSVRVKHSSGKVVEVKNVKGIDRGHDLVLLEIPLAGRPLELATRIPEIGEDLVAIANPKGREGTFSAGIVSGIWKGDGSVHYQITAAISPGRGGGPIIDERGTVVGVSTFQVEGGRELHLAMPTAYVHRLLRSKDNIPLKIAAKHRAQAPMKAASDRVRVIEPEISGFFKSYEASIVNKTPNAIKNVRMVVTFYPARSIRERSAEEDQDPVHYMLIKVKEMVPAKLAIRFSRSDYFLKGDWDAKARVLDYDIIENSDESAELPVFK